MAQYSFEDITNAPQTPIPVQTEGVPLQSAENATAVDVPAYNWEEVDTKKTPEETVSTSLGQDIKRDTMSSLRHRQTQMADLFHDIKNGDIDADTALAQFGMIGVVAPILDTGGAVLGNVLSTGVETALDAASSVYAYLPDTVQTKLKGTVSLVNNRKDVQLYKDGINWALNSPAADEAWLAAQDTAESYAEWAEENPVDARTLEGVVNVSTLLFPGRNQGQSWLFKGKNWLEESAGKTSEKLGRYYMQPAKTEQLVAAGSVKTSWFRNKESIELTSFEEEVVSALGKTSITPSRPIAHNVNIVRDRITELDTTLKRSLTGVPINQQSVITRIQTNLNNFMESSSSLRDMDNTKFRGFADDFAAEAAKYMREEGTDAAAVLRVRQRLDRWFDNQKKITEPSQYNPMDAAWREVRNALNTSIEAAAPSVGVRQSLRQSHLLYEARTVMSAKSAEQAGSALGRGLQYLHQSGAALPSTPLAQMALIGALGSSPWLGYISVPIAVAAASKLAWNRTITPGNKRMIAQMIGDLGRAVGAEKDPIIRNMIKADRAVLQDLIQSIPTGEEEPSVAPQP